MYQEPEDSNFKIVYVDLVHGCNMECANCYLPNRDYPNMDTDKILSTISRFPKRTEFRFIGGEPTLHKDLPYIIESVHGMPLRHRVALVTNGLRLASRRYTENLKRAGLKTAYLSMTGFDDDEVYKLTDNLACAKQKMRALNNCVENKIRLALGCIVIKGLNEHVIGNMKDYLDKLGIRASLEFRNVGQIGRYMVGNDSSENYTFGELLGVVCDTFGADKETLNVIESDGYSFYFRHGRYRIGVTDWSGVRIGFPEETNSIRGRITENFKVAPFLEHVAANENGY